MSLSAKNSWRFLGWSRVDADNVKSHVAIQKEFKPKLPGARNG
jgi:hypothetical protein